MEFCSLNYGVTFPIFSKIHVKGPDIHPLYRFLTDPELNNGFGGKITWNFNKFLVGKNGNILARYDSKVKPDDPKIVQELEALLWE